MRSLPLVATVLMSACSTAPAAPVVHGETPGHTCEATGTDSFVGQQGTSQAGAAIKRATHAAVPRWAPPGGMLTMGFRADRVTPHLGPDKASTKPPRG